MTKRMNLVQAKEIEGREKPIWIRLGSVFMDGDKIKGIKMDALPLPDAKGEVWLRAFEDDGGQQQPAPQMAPEVDPFGNVVGQ